jgi:hypothetical protein
MFEDLDNFDNFDYQEVLNNRNNMSVNTSVNTSTTASQMSSDESQKDNKTASQKSLVDHLKKRKGLYQKVKRAYLQRVSDEIEKGNKGNIAFDKFVFELIDLGLEN